MPVLGSSYYKNNMMENGFCRAGMRLLALFLLNVVAASTSQRCTSSTCEESCSFVIFPLEENLKVHVEYQCFGEHPQEKQYTTSFEDLSEHELIPGVKLFAETTDGLVVVQVSGGHHLNMVDSVIKGFTDGIAAPVFVEEGSLLHMERGQISQNTGTLSGGVAALSGSLLVLDHSRFEGNSGGAVVVKGDTTLASLNNVTLFMNTAHSLAVDLVVGDGAVVNATASTFSGASRDSDAAGVYFQQSHWNSWAWENLLSTNDEGLWSSVYVGDGSHLIMSDSTLKWFVSSHGAMNCAKDSTVKLLRTDITSNFGMKGGGILSEGGNVALEGCNFEGNFGEFGGAIASLEGGQLSMASCIFTDNIAAVGGAVYVGHGITDECSIVFDGGSCNIEKSTFERNTAQLDGGSIYSVCESFTLLGSRIDAGKAGGVGGGLASRNSEEATILNTNVTNCTGEKGGGLFMLNVGEVNLNVVGLSDNQALEDGGAAQISRSGQFNAVSTKVINNRGGNGGGFSLDSVEQVNLTQCKILSNSATALGGGIHLQDALRLDAANLVISSNNATTGGGLWMVGSDATEDDVAVPEQFHPIVYATQETTSVRMTDSLVTANNAEQQGGGVYMKLLPGVTCQSCVFSKNSAGLSGGGLYMTNTTTAYFIDLRGTDNIAQKLGGFAVLSRIPSLSMDSSTISSNSAGRGGGFYAYMSRLVLTDVNVMNNMAVAQMAGGFMASSCSSILVQKSLFEGNTANGNGGAIATSNVISTVIDSSTFGSNQAATGSGGAISVVSPTATAEFEAVGCAFSDNQARLSGGAIAQIGQYVYFGLLRSSFSSNVAGLFGGCVFLKSVKNAVFDESSFAASSADSGGGSVYVAVAESVSVASSEFEESRSLSGSGGALFLQDVISTTIQKSNFSACSCVDGTGGAIRMAPIDVDSSSSLVLDSDHFYGNTAAGGGGGFIEKVSSISIQDTTYEGNSCETRDGGAMAIEDTIAIELSGCVLQDNAAGGNGGALSVVHAKNLKISSYFAENKAVHRSGGAIFGDHIDDMYISGSFFHLNKAQLTGGGISSVSINALSISETLFDQNSAQVLSGGAISVESGMNLDITTSQFTENSAVSGGAMWLHETPPQQLAVNVSDTSFTKNYATHEGGALFIQGDTKSQPTSDEVQITQVPAPILMILKNATLDGNSAETGGALMVEEGFVYLEATSVLKNRAKETGGGFTCKDGAVMRLSETRIIGNSANTASGFDALCTCNVTMYDCSIRGNAALDHNGESIGACSGNVQNMDTDISGNSSGNRPWWHFLILAVLVISFLLLIIAIIFCLCATIRHIKAKNVHVYNAYEALGPIDPDADLMLLVHERMQADVEHTDSNSEGLPPKDLPESYSGPGDDLLDDSPLGLSQSPELSQPEITQDSSIDAS